MANAARLYATLIEAKLNTKKLGGENSDISSSVQEVTKTTIIQKKEHKCLFRNSRFH